ncbi:tRNA (adenosine(37)-N6)-threonylcarbamoyltransferase complex ATPase subunit type 1 TsaE [Patescibacteria group bacterium]|nr:tRNA (adenosine(37)-N6)-threonylcarbamoyltransferase complex ATPase subunit type 1 TsaE [Patescibacteria group bacterium]
MASISDKTTLRLSTAKNAQLAGESLAETLYTAPITIFLTGELGVGKTTFLQGFARKLGIKEHLTSPTYALEQRYQTERYGELLHLDLFRLSEAQAEEVAKTSDDHEGIRCIEWSDRLPNHFVQNGILIELTENECRTSDLGLRTSDVLSPKSEVQSSDVHTRICTIQFTDIPLPSYEEVNLWREEVKLQPHIIEHCEVVADFAVRCANALINNGIIVRKLALQRAAQLHDLLRFFDFHLGRNGNYEDASDEIKEIWEKWEQKYPNADGHESACAAFLREHGYSELAEIVTLHGLRSPNPPHMTTEQKLLFYADKRVRFTEVVSVEERFKDINDRYENKDEPEFVKKWHEKTIALEKELFGDNIPL